MIFSEVIEWKIQGVLGKRKFISHLNSIGDLIKQQGAYGFI